MKRRSHGSSRKRSVQPGARRSALLVLVLASWGGLSGCTRDRDRNGVVASGYIEATSVRVATKVGGVVREVAAREGDPVPSGAYLARIDSVDLALALAAARADRDQAEAELRLRLAGTRAEEIREAAAQEARAAAELEAADRDLNRMQTLLDRGSGTVKARDDARNRRDQAGASHDAAREQLLRRKNGFRPEEIEAARARAAGAAARVAQLAQQLEDTRIASPLEGTVAERLLEPGELAAPGTAVCVVSDLRHPWLSVYVGEADLGRIRLGAPVVVRVGSGAARTGSISWISDQAEFTPRNVQTREERARLVYKIKISLPNDDGLFKPGMPAEASLSMSGGRP